MSNPRLLPPPTTSSGRDVKENAPKTATARHNVNPDEHVPSSVRVGHIGNHAPEGNDMHEGLQFRQLSSTASSSQARPALASGNGDTGASESFGADISCALTSSLTHTSEPGGPTVREQVAMPTLSVSRVAAGPSLHPPDTEAQEHVSDRLRAVITILQQLSWYEVIMVLVALTMLVVVWYYNSRRV